MPTTTFSITTGTDDGIAERVDTVYPPVTNAAASTSGVNLIPQKQLSGGNYTVRVALLRFDTSSLGSGATVTGANLKIYVNAKTDNDARNLVAGYYDWSPSVDTGDWIITPATDAFTVDITTITTSAVNTIALSNLSNINTTGYTYFRLGVDGGAPSINNRVSISSYDHATDVEPQLEVTYTVGAAAGRIYYAYQQ